MTYYLGHTGALIALPDPEVGLQMTPERIGSTHQLLSGSRVRDTIGRMRTWNLSWTAIDLTTYGTLQQFFYDTGPYYFFDVEQRNLLVPNVSAAGSYTGDLTGFTTGPNGVTASPSQSLLTSPIRRVLVGDSTSVVAFQNLLQQTAVTPVVPNATYTFSGWSAVPSPTPGIYSNITYYDSGMSVSSSTDGSVLSNTTGWLAQTVAAPSNAAFARWTLKSAAANATGSIQYWSIEQLQFEQASSRSAWVPGIGVPLVTVENLSRSTPLAGICDAQMTLVQVS